MLVILIFVNTCTTATYISTPISIPGVSDTFAPNMFASAITGCSTSTFSIVFSAASQELVSL